MSQPKNIMQQKRLPSFYWECIVKTYWSGQSSFPTALGLASQNYTQLKNHFNLFNQEKLNPQQTVQRQRKRDIYQELFQIRLQERNEISALLSDYANSNMHFAAEMAVVVATACLGSEHLWKDLGLPERGALTVLMSVYFPDFAKKNSQNMRWKKFIYKQLCELGGDYICRAPSCNTCRSFDECFSPED